MNPRIARYMLAKSQGSLYDFDKAAPGMDDAYARARGDVEPVAINEATQGDDVPPNAAREAALDVPQQAALPGVEPEELDAFPQPLTAPPMVAAQAPVAAPDDEGDDDESMARARRLDANSALARGFEQAGRQLVAGISRTPEAGLVTQQTQAVGQAQAAQKTRAQRLRDAAEMARRSRMDDSAIETQEADRIEKLARAAALSREKRTGLDPALEGRRLDIKEESERNANAIKSRALDIKEAAANKPKPVKPPKVERGVPEGWEVNPTSPPTEPMKAVFAKLVYDDHNIKGLTAKMKRLVEQASVRGRLDPTQNEEIKQTAGMLDMAVKEVPKLGALSGPDMGIIRAISVDPTNVSSLVKDQGKLLGGIDEWMGLSVAAGERAYGFRKAAPGGERGGKIRMSNGRETLDVAAEDEAAAAKDGFKRVK